ncbi:uncharacterized protein EV422DRAFT_551194 [Fimicolochytrium jonesii]|uniref:uncharacterized protein n=1 Tax=Fimicolochytrium jonesii TaxID=1396493 RepID=UPI0022FDB37C|nr:uncharacterized protein EV422DRAFT_551194 [Fimicolochytrium jonesii]KAI8818519.1 hypothetical protein EV422DRAFT_551194 [Fimicolochytrium jonesii]
MLPRPSPIHLLKRHLATAAPSTPHVGILLKRNPIILRTLSEFEHAYLAYRDSLEHSESRPFDPSFYFKKGSTAEKRWVDAQEQQAETVTVEEGEKIPLVQPRDELSTDEIAPRRTKADEVRDMKSLDRALERTLYLVVKRKDGGWRFPAGKLEGQEVLSEGAARHLRTEVGKDLETWVVGNTPVGVWKGDKEKVFYMKAHILSGKISANPKLVEDHAWATKQELKEYLSPDYYQSVQRMLAEL